MSQTTKTLNRLFLSPVKIKKIKNFLNNEFALYILSIIIAVCWFFNLPVISLTIITIFEIFVFIFCRDNPKAFMFPILALFYCPKYIPTGWLLIYTIICLGIFMSFVIMNIIWQIKTKKIKCTKGKLFWAFLLVILANFLGGVIGNFNILMSVASTGFLILIYGVYWYTLNFIKSEQNYFLACAVFLTLTISLEIIFSIISQPNLLEVIVQKKASAGVGEPGTGSINCAAIMMLPGLCATLFLGIGKKRDYLFLILALFFDIVLFFSYSRIALFLGILSSLIFGIILIVKSKNKKLILFGLLTIFVIALIIFLIYLEDILSFFNYYINMGFSLNGRSSLWSWCWETFLKNPIFGIGITTSDPYVLSGNTPGMSLQGTFAYVHTHNLFLQHLTCTGIVGLILNIPFYIQKYKILFKKFTFFKLFCLIMFGIIFLSGLFDPTYPVCFFLIFYELALLASSEKISFNNALDEKEQEINQ